MTQEHVPVLIVGAGGAGLSLSLLLLQQGIQPLVVERRADISIYPRARNLTFRSLEVFRGLGLEAEVRAVATSASQTILKEKLSDSASQKMLDAAELLEHLQVLSPDPVLQYCPQSSLEPVLLTAAQQRGGDVRYGTELVSFTQDEQGVTATLKERASGRVSVVRADYLVAADGTHSHIRETLGIPSQGLGELPEYLIFVYFRAPLQEFIAGHEADAFVIRNADVFGMFLPAREDLGLFAITYRPEKGEAFGEFTAERCKDLILKAIGQEIPVEIVDIAPWRATERVADQFQQGRVFLAGDAAHTMPPYKGLGVNTAIQSAQNLAWKLAAVIRGQADSELLATYQAERHPVARFVTEQSLTGPAAAWLVKVLPLPEEKDLPLFYPIVGYRYRSQALLEEAEVSASRDEIALLDSQELTGLPGTRVPHVWLERQGQRISTLDLLDGRFVLLTGKDGAPWCEAKVSVKASLGIELAAYRIGPDADLLDLEHDWSTRLGVSPEGAVLIRPDGFVAWRTSALTATPGSDLAQVLSRILGRPTEPPYL
jgi:2-polyprenyl-6-methoxyphenol hydroxylase-like FAD-dependent oxidoreductase